MKATIYIPEHLMSVRFSSSLVAVAGGVTITEALGYWKDEDEDVIACDAMLLASVIFDRDARHEVRTVLTDICAELHRNGEKVVLVETWDNARYNSQFVRESREVVVW